PNRRDPVEITPTVGVFQVDALASFDDNRRFFFPFALLCKWVPQVAAVIGLQPPRAGLGKGIFIHRACIIGGGCYFDNVTQTPLYFAQLSPKETRCRPAYETSLSSRT